MKTKITIAGMMFASFFMVNTLKAQIDLAMGNISAGWNTYNSGTGMITGVYFDVLNNDNGAASSFDVKVYLVDPNDYTISYAVWTYTDSDGQNGNTAVTYDNIDIDFNATSGIPAGQYRLAVCVDPDNYITETDDNNNCLFISTMGNNLTYSPGSAAIDNATSNGGLTIYPNPATDRINIVQENGWENATVNLLDLSGKMVRSVNLNLQLTEMDLMGLNAGLYLYQVLDVNGKLLTTGKIIKE